MTPKSSSAERMRELRERMRKAGFVLIQLWAHPGDHEQIKAYVARLSEKRKDSLAARLAAKRKEKP